MIYMTCPTCGYFIGSKIIDFETKREYICNDPKNNDKDKEVKIKQLIESLKLRRYCCKMRLLSSKDLVQDILGIEN